MYLCLPPVETIYYGDDRAERALIVCCWWSGLLRAAAAQRRPLGAPRLTKFLSELSIPGTADGPRFRQRITIGRS